MTREERSIKLIQEFEPKKGYLVGNSGGKDSIVLDHLMKRAGVKFKSIFNYTTVDPPEVKKFIREYYPNTVWLYPKDTMFQGIVKYDLPMRNQRWCCDKLKHYANKWNMIATGIRAEESVNRANNRSELDWLDNYAMLNPILKWSTRQIWLYIKDHKLPYCKLYDEGYTRIGCIGCPMGSNRQIFNDFERYPNVKKAYLWSIQKRIDKGKYKDFDDANDVFDWWISGISAAKYFGIKEQIKLEF